MVIHENKLLFLVYNVNNRQKKMPIKSNMDNKTIVFFIFYIYYHYFVYVNNIIYYLDY